MKSIKRIAAALLVLFLIIPQLMLPVDTARAAETDKEGKIADEVRYNTGNYEVQVVSEETFKKKGDAAFAKDGSYTINIPESNPFFPYEVQFICNGVTENKWFMTPDDSVEVGGHEFKVSAYFDNTELTQASLMVAGKEVIVYPEEKNFTNDGDMTMPLSLLPLEEKYLSVDLTGFTPLELTAISIGKLFSGNELEGASKVVWDESYNGDDYEVTTPEADINIRDITSLNIIVGDGDQLNSNNKRYRISVKKSDYSEWIKAEVYMQDKSGVRSQISAKAEYENYSTVTSNGIRHRRLEIYTSKAESQKSKYAYIKLNFNNEIFADKSFDNIKVYEGSYATAEEAMKGKDITNSIFCKDMSQKDSGYLADTDKYIYITLVGDSLEQKNKVCLPIAITFINSYFSVSSSMYRLSDEQYTDVSSGRRYSYPKGYTSITYKLYSQYPANEKYYCKLYYYNEGKSDASGVTAAYIGLYSSIGEAQKAGAKDIKDELFYNYGYGADYSKGIYFSVFAGEDGSLEQVSANYYIKTETTEAQMAPTSDYKNSGTGLYINGLYDTEGKSVTNYKVSSDDDTYGEDNYITILVDKDTDITNLAPAFSNSSKSNVYAEGGSSPEESGKSYHDFSSGPIQYTVSAENGTNSSNYWLSVIKPQEGEGKIYITSFADDDSATKVENNVTYSTRQVMLDNLHDNEHDILVANIGTQAISNLAVELDSTVVELDEYWTFTGKSDLEGFSTVKKTTSYGELPNLAKIRIKAKQGVESGTDVSGTLTIKSGSSKIAVLTLTGTVGDPSIITKEIPKAVKYVPYGTMIQNSNKYSWNKVSYELVSGKLPDGMEVKANGEIYGVPRESGKFSFMVRMNNSYSSFSSSTKVYTLEVDENSDENVDNATDTGYDLTQRITDVNNSTNYLLVSQGIISEFRALYLDGQKLVEGTDYNAKSGSTRITIEGQTLNNAGTGKHTLGVEFRAADDTLKRAAQNYTIYEDDEDDDNDNNTTLSESDLNNSGSVETGKNNNENVTNVQHESMPAAGTVTSDSSDVYMVTYLGDGVSFLSVKCSKSHAYDISLKNSDAAFPITVIMTPPYGIDMSKTAIIHLTAENEIDEVFYNGNGYTYDEQSNKVTFTVSHFSKFIFAEFSDAEEMSNELNISAPTGDMADCGKWWLLLLISGGVFTALSFRKKCF